MGTRWLVVPLLGIRSSTNNGVVPKIIISPSKKSWKIPGETSLPWNLASALKSQPHHPEWHRPPIEQKTNKVVGRIIYTHSTSTKLRYLARNKTESELPTLGVTQGNLGLTSLPHPSINARNEKIKLQIHPAFSFRSATSGIKRGTHLLGG